MDGVLQYSISYASRRRRNRTRQYVYLGQELSQDHQQGLAGEISRRIKAAWHIFNSISEVLKKLTDSTRRAQLFNSTVLPALLYGCQTWTLTNKQADRLRTTQRAMERRVLGVTMWDCRRNEDIRAETRFRDPVQEATKLKLKWSGHVAWRNDNWWTLDATKWNPKKKPRKDWGRPTRWDQLVVKKIGSNWVEAAQDRSEWRNQCTATPSPRRMSIRVDEPAGPED